MAASTLLTRKCQPETNASVRERNKENVVKYLNEENVVKYLSKAEDTDPADLGSSITFAKNLLWNTLAIV